MMRKQDDEAKGCLQVMIGTLIVTAILGYLGLLP